MNLAEAAGRRTFPGQRAGEQVPLDAFATYTEAPSLVDYLADPSFDVATTQIVGGLRVVGQFAGRSAWSRAILSGMAGGVTVPAAEGR